MCYFSIVNVDFKLFCVFLSTMVSYIYRVNPCIILSVVVSSAFNLVSRGISSNVIFVSQIVSPVLKLILDGLFTC